MIARITYVLSRATAGPLLARAGVFAVALAALVVGFPAEMRAGYFTGVLVILAGAAAILPRSPLVTLAILVAVAGWVISTIWYEDPVELWRLIALASFLYLTHSLAALAALLPYDAHIPAEVTVRWLSRALAVVLGAAVLTVLLLSAANQGGERDLLPAALAGLAVAVGATGLLAWLLRRR
ncbi:hypothetical protein RB614_29725 [Phytohabitans sp. ZYX-F-186]|uniref:Uncharacterized protein n=1 Tax=Phytohabitans maris TaxID=3071409 RepID=A0ABU0ZR67_9ACTN|nr:hypothetical protein [Phytohabitans sp. ZYX-F-186]MDQ7908720.1 hypothetical protein [Phytohabitans sp. ZYX-F-186]